MTSFARIGFRLPHIALAGIACGDGPPALFFHGITANAHVWEPVMAALADRFRCIAVDQRGHGRSDKPATGYAADDFATDIAAMVRHLDAGPALLVGHSLGSRNALAAGARDPSCVRAVIGIDFTPFIETAVFDALDARVGGGDRTFPSLDAVRAYLAERYPRLPADAIERRALHGYFAAPGGFRPLADGAAMAAISRGLREDLAPAVSAIRVPALLVRGADSRLVSPEAWARTLALRPDVAAVELAGADHYVPEEVPQAVAAAIRSFVSS
jgi:2-(acetamidomethylene)succinate hydrolase